MENKDKNLTYLQLFQLKLSIIAAIIILIINLLFPSFIVKLETTYNSLSTLSGDFYDRAVNVTLPKIGQEFKEYLQSLISAKTEQVFFNLSEATKMGLTFERPINGAEISDSFGFRSDPFTGEKSFHSGTDYAAPLDTEVFASTDGMVFSAGFDDNYGNYVMLKHSNNAFTLYAHLDDIAVYKGMFVVKGMVVGRVGSTGRSTGFHLHFEIIIDNYRVDPELLYKNVS